MGAWAFALGTAIGWGSLVVTSNSYLLQAGPWGSIIGLLIGALIMLVIARNYHYLINCFPDAGGAYTYSKELFGHDYGFLTAWFLGLTYVAIFWANATSVPLFAHFFLGDMFRVGYLYTVFGYDVYAGEVALTMVAIGAAALLCARSRKGVMWVMIGLAALLSCAIMVCYFASVLGSGGSFSTIEPGYLPDKSVLSQILLIACISPWAFIGFENISHSAEEFAFPRNKSFRIMVAAVVTATALYVFVLLLSVMAYPPEYGSWFEYLSDLGNLEGIKGLPPFYVAHHYLGDAGIYLLMFALFALVTTSLIGNTVALSRLLHALAKDSVLPSGIASINKWHIPGKAILFVAALSMFIPFLGRTAIGWIVDVTTIGATIVYGIVSASAMRVAHARGDQLERVTGIAGIVFMIIFGLYIIISALLMSQNMAPESFFLFAAWGILGFICFRFLLGGDAERRFGRSVVVWIALLAIVMFVTFVWMSQSVLGVADSTMGQIHAYFFANGAPSAQQLADHEFIEQSLEVMQGSSAGVMVVAAALFALAPAMLLTSISHMSRWARKSEEELEHTRSIVYTDPLTGLPSMSRFHELASEGARAMLEQGDRPVAMAMDLVGMKDYNSEHGRDGGEKLLCALADVLSKHFGDKECSRFSEDHFYAYAPESQAYEKVTAVFEDFKVANGGSTLPIRVGAYVCSFDDDIVDVGFDRARAACDLDRKTWESHVRWFSVEMNDEAKLRLHILDSVNQAIEQKWIKPYYQAIVRASTGEVCNEEALARWIDPEYGFMSPGVFIPILEEAGLLHKVDMHMIDCVLADMATKREHGVPVVPVSVNISLRDVEQLDISNEISKRVNSAGISQELLRIEFTESAASDDPELFKKEIEILHDAHFDVWMDDFGSGYSSLNSLKDFDFNLVKLDMEFMRGEHTEKTWDIIAGVVDITRKIGVRTLAEGVETEAQADRLTKVGCDMLQGYYFAKPQSLEDVIESFESGSGLPRETHPSA